MTTKPLGCLGPSQDGQRPAERRSSPRSPTRRVGGWEPWGSECATWHALTSSFPLAHFTFSVAPALHQRRGVSDIASVNPELYISANSVCPSYLQAGGFFVGTVGRSCLQALVLSTWARLPRAMGRTRTALPRRVDHRVSVTLLTGMNLDRDISGINDASRGWIECRSPHPDRGRAPRGQETRGRANIDASHLALRSGYRFSRLFLPGRARNRMER